MDNVQDLKPAATAEGKRWGTARSITAVMVAIFLIWLVYSHFMGLRGLGYVDSAIVTMRTLVADENEFARSRPTLGYTCKLTDITPDPILAEAHKNEYVFEISDCLPQEKRGPNRSYQVTARPSHPDRPAFCSDQSEILRADYQGSVLNCLKSGVPL
jgi:hypothetical protein